MSSHRPPAVGSARAASSPSGSTDAWKWARSAGVMYLEGGRGGGQRVERWRRNGENVVVLGSHQRAREGWAQVPPWGSSIRFFFPPPSLPALSTPPAPPSMPLCSPVQVRPRAGPISARLGAGRQGRAGAGAPPAPLQRARRGRQAQAPPLPRAETAAGAGQGRRRARTGASAPKLAQDRQAVQPESEALWVRGGVGRSGKRRRKNR